MANEKCETFLGCQWNLHTFTSMIDVLSVCPHHFQLSQPQIHSIKNSLAPQPIKKFLDIACEWLFVFKVYYINEEFFWEHSTEQFELQNNLNNIPLFTFLLLLLDRNFQDASQGHIVGWMSFPISLCACGGSAHWCTGIDSLLLPISMHKQLSLMISLFVE